jgi:hypothetical protein
VQALEDDGRVERDEDREVVGGRIGVGDAAADRPAVPDLYVADH